MVQSQDLIKLNQIPAEEAYLVLKNRLSKDIFEQTTFVINEEYRKLFRSYERNSNFQIGIIDLNTLKEASEENYSLFKKQYHKNLSAMLRFFALPNRLGIKRVDLKHDRNLLKKDINHTVVATYYVNDEKQLTIDSIYHLRPQVIYLTFMQGVKSRLMRDEDERLLKMKQIDHIMLKSLGDATIEHIARMLAFYFKAELGNDYPVKELTALLPHSFKIKVDSNLLHVVLMFHPKNELQKYLPIVNADINNDTSLSAHYSFNEQLGSNQANNQYTLSIDFI